MDIKACLKECFTEDDKNLEKASLDGYMYYNISNQTFEDCASSCITPSETLLNDYGRRYLPDTVCSIFAFISVISYVIFFMIPLKKKLSKITCKTIFLWIQMMFSISFLIIYEINGTILEMFESFNLYMVAFSYASVSLAISFFLSMAKLIRDATNEDNDETESNYCGPLTIYLCIFMTIAHVFSLSLNSFLTIFIALIFVKLIFDVLLFSFSMKRYQCFYLLYYLFLYTISNFALIYDDSPYNFIISMKTLYFLCHILIPFFFFKLWDIDHKSRE